MTKEKIAEVARALWAESYSSESDFIQAVIDKMQAARTGAVEVPNEQGKNRYGLDMAYFRRLINRELNRPLTDFKPDELARVLARASRTADPVVLHEPEFARAGGEVEPYAWRLEHKSDEYDDHVLMAFEYSLEDRCADEKLGWIYTPLFTHQKPAAKVPDGWKMVPVEPTDDQVNRGWLSKHPVSIYKAMLNAAPQPVGETTVPEGWRETIALAAGHLGDWLDAHECECEMGHICGRPSVERTREQLLDILTAAPQPVEGYDQ